jgi:hypothetical protein
VSCVMSDNHHCRCRQFRHDRGEHPIQLHRFQRL